jgi:hypothetical protein
MGAIYPEEDPPKMGNAQRSRKDRSFFRFVQTAPYEPDDRDEREKNFSRCISCNTLRGSRITTLFCERCSRGWIKRLEGARCDDKRWKDLEWIRKENEKYTRIQ